MSVAVSHQTIAVNDRRGGGSINLFYREAGPKDAPVVLLLHGFPTSSHQYRGLIPRLADKYRVIAPDLPGFGFSDAPAADTFEYGFDHLAEVMASFVDAMDLPEYALYVFDYGSPVGFRLAASRPERVTALISQNGNAYEEGLSEGWNPMRAYWRDPSPENRSALRGFLTQEITRFQYLQGETDQALVSPDGPTLDQHFLDRPGSDEIQLDLLRDYRSNVESYPAFHHYFRMHRPPLLAVWGKNDPFFLPAGAEAFRRDLPDAQIAFVDAGHFALEGKLDDVVRIVRPFLARHLDRRQGATLFGALAPETAPQAAQPHLETMRNVFGFVPNLGYALAQEPAVLGAYLGMLQALGNTSLEPIAQQVAMVAASRANEAAYGIAVHATLAGKLGAGDAVVKALREGGPLPDERLDVVRRFAGSIAGHRTQVSDSEVKALRDAGYDERAMIAIALAVAAKTLVNAVAHLARPIIDDAFLAHGVNPVAA